MAKKKETEFIGGFDVIDGFVLENADKLERVINGDVKRAGVPEGGLGEKADPKLVLAHYDKLGGLITKDVGGDRRVKIKNGAFWDVKKKAPRVEPEIMYLFRIGGDEIEVDNPSNLASAVTTLSSAIAEKEAVAREKRERAKRKRLTK